MLFAALGYWGIGASLGLGLAFGAGLGPPGIWVGLAAGLAVVAVLMLGRWSRRDGLGLLNPSLASELTVGGARTFPRGAERENVS
jgi:MATE family multidrug resistance protein